MCIHFFCVIVLLPILLLSPPPHISSLPSSPRLCARAKLSVKPLQPASSNTSSSHHNPSSSSCTSYKVNLLNLNSPNWPIIPLVPLPLAVHTHSHIVLNLILCEHLYRPHTYAHCLPLCIILSLYIMSVIANESSDMFWTMSNLLQQSAVVELWSNMHCLTCQSAVPDWNVADHPAETTAQGAPQGKGVHISPLSL